MERHNCNRHKVDQLKSTFIAQKQAVKEINMSGRGDKSDGRGNNKSHYNSYDAAKSAERKYDSKSTDLREREIEKFS